MAEEHTEKDAGALDLSALGSFDFTPAWAKGKPDDAAKFARFEAREETPARGERPRFAKVVRAATTGDRVREALAATSVVRAVTTGVRAAVLAVRAARTVRRASS